MTTTELSAIMLIEARGGPLRRAFPTPAKGEVMLVSVVVVFIVAFCVGFTVTGLIRGPR